MYRFALTVCCVFLCSTVGRAGDEVNNTADFEGSAPLGITYDEDNDRLIVVDLFDGTAHTYSLELRYIGEIDAPCVTEPVVCTGIAFNPDAKEGERLFWVDGFHAELHQTDDDGEVIETFELDVPAGGLVGGITYDVETESFWGLDIAADVCFEFDEEGASTGRTFVMPGKFERQGTFGNGLTSVPGTLCLDILSGSFDEGIAMRVVRVDINGAPAGGSIDYGPRVTQGSFLNGIQYHEEGSTGKPVHYIVDNGSNTILEIEVDLECEPCELIEGISSVECAETEPGTVTLSWADTGDTRFDDVDLLASGEVLETIEADATEVEIELAPGVHELTLQFSSGDESCITRTCRLAVVGDGQNEGQRVVRAPAGAELQAITVCESNDRIYCPDVTSRDCYVFDLDLTHVETIVRPILNLSIRCHGIAWNPEDDSLYWVTYQTTTAAQRLWVSDLDGVLLDDYPIESPSKGLLGAVDISADGEGLIINDVIANEYFLFDFEGELIRKAGFAGPDPALRSYGIATLPTASAYEVITASESDPNVIARVDSDGTELGCFEDLGPENFLFDARILGVALTDEGGPDGASGTFRYATGQLHELLFADPVVCRSRTFIRGDADGNGKVSVCVDVLAILKWGYLEGEPPPCFDAADVNGDGNLEPLADAMYLIAWGFNRGADPPNPGPNQCGREVDDDDLSCEVGCP